jgi:hypothetical protein
MCKRIYSLLCCWPLLLLLLPAAMCCPCSMSVVKTYCGHGIGDLFHCAPNIPHYAHNKAVGVMKEGQVRRAGGGGVLPGRVCWVRLCSGVKRGRQQGRLAVVV